MSAVDDSWTATRHSPFADSSPFNTKIPPDATVHPNSAAMVAQMARDGAMNVNLVEFGIPIYTATSDSPLHEVRCTVTEWGPCPFDGHQVPIPDDAQPNPGSDAAMVVVDPISRLIYELWQADPDEAGWTAGFGEVTQLDGSGWEGTGTAAGASRLGGVIRVHEIERGLVPHALALQSDNTCAAIFVPPATNADGTSTRSDCVPQGSLVRLDPALDLYALPLTPAERIVGKALQDYGGYVVDSGGAPLSVSFELDPTAPEHSIGNVYQQAGLRWDYDRMRGLPYDRLQVLNPTEE